jgi:hypothetical protein
MDNFRTDFSLIDWQDVDDRIQIRRQRQQEKLKNLNGLIQSSRFNLEFVNSDCKLIFYDFKGVSQTHICYEIFPKRRFLLFSKAKNN